MCECLLHSLACFASPFVFHIAVATKAWSTQQQQRLLRQRPYSAASGMLPLLLGTVELILWATRQYRSLYCCIYTWGRVCYYLVNSHGSYSGRRAGCSCSKRGVHPWIVLYLRRKQSVYKVCVQRRRFEFFDL